jgi:EmrB/QacA subfamily drug resistance transporter
MNRVAQINPPRHDLEKTDLEKTMAPSVDYSRKWYAMSAVAMAIFLATIDGSIVNLALPTLVRELQISFATVQWVVLAYLLTLTTLMLGIGRLADIRGKKPIFVAGFVVFTVGSVLCAFSPTVYWLIAFRIVQAIGGAMMLALGAAIVTEAFPPQERGKAMGIIGSTVSIGIVAGPLLGGLIISVLSWHWIFLVNLPIGIIGTIMAMRFVPALQPPGGQHFDYGGAATLCISLLALLLGLTLGQEQGFGQPFVLGLFAVWLVFLGVFIAIELRIPSPMIDLRLFQNRQFSVNLGTGLITFVAIAGVFILMPFYLENILGYPIQWVGPLLAVVPVMLGVMAPLAGVLSDRFGTRPITVAGLVVLLMGYLAIATLRPETTALGYIVRLAPIGIGMGIFQSPNNSAVMGAVPRERLGIASGLLSVTRTLGQTIGIAVMGAIWAGRVAAYMGGEPVGATTSAPAAIQVAAMRDTFFVVVVLVGIALAVAVWAWMQERGRVTAARSNPQAPVASD